MKFDTDLKISSMAGFGPAAWGGDTQKVSMHPPIPGHIEFIEEAMQSQKQKHIVQRRHPENDNEVTLHRGEITAEDMDQHSHLLNHLIHMHQREADHKTKGTNAKHKACAAIRRLLRHRHPDR